MVVHRDPGRVRHHVAAARAHAEVAEGVAQISCSCGELAPFRDRHEEVEACCRYFERNLGRVRYDGFRERGVQVGSGVVEGGCRQFGLRMKRSGTRWSKRGANAMLALKGCAMNLRLPDFLEWRTNHAIAA